MAVFSCNVCQTSLTADEDQAGTLVRCPGCLSTLRVPEVPRNLAGAKAAPKPPAAPRPQPAPRGGEANDDDIIGFAIDDTEASADHTDAPTDDTKAASDPHTSLPGADPITADPAATGPAASGELAIAPAALPPRPAPRVPQPPPSARPAGARPVGAPFRSNGGPGKRYGFNCAYCSSRLEATESMAAQEGQCPTCGNSIVIPILDKYNRLIDPITRQIIKQDPHPVHAYAAAGERAPQILRQPDGLQIIRCAKCGRTSPITANNCKTCGMPFTMEGTTPEAAGASNGYCVASLVLGIISIPFSCLVIPGVLAVIFGIVGLTQTGSGGSGNGQGGNGRGGRGLAIAGLICGGTGLLITILFYTR